MLTAVVGRPGHNGFASGAWPGRETGPTTGLRSPNPEHMRAQEVMARSPDRAIAPTEGLLLLNRAKLPPNIAPTEGLLLLNLIAPTVGLLLLDPADILPMLERYSSSAVSSRHTCYHSIAVIGTSTNSVPPDKYHAADENRQCSAIRTSPFRRGLSCR
jgi:hypothetical protein